MNSLKISLATFLVLSVSTAAAIGIRGGMQHRNSKRALRTRLAKGSGGAAGADNSATPTKRMMMKSKMASIEEDDTSAATSDGNTATSDNSDSNDEPKTEWPELVGVDGEEAKVASGFE